MGVNTKGWGKKSRRTGRKWPKISKQSLADGRRLGFRSGLEVANARVIEARGEEVQFEPFKIPYTVPASAHKYTMDFCLENGICIETKGKLEPKDRGKHILIKEQYPELDIRFIFQRPHDKIYKGSPTSYASWCENQGFLWASKVIPESWFEEAGPKRHPRDVIKEKQ